MCKVESLDRQKVLACLFLCQLLEEEKLCVLTLEHRIMDPSGPMPSTPAERSRQHEVVAISVALTVIASKSSLWATYVHQC